MQTKPRKQESTGFDFLKLWPILFVPATLYVVMQFGNDYANILVAILFFGVFAFKSDMRTRRLMLVLAAMGNIFETANTAAGFYKYIGTLGAPLWIPLGWAVLGWWVASMEGEFRKISMKTGMAVTSAALLLSPLAVGSISISSIIAIAGLYCISLASRLPYAAFGFTALFSIMLEYMGTTIGAWQYFDPMGSGAPIPPNLAALAMAYATALALCLWISGFEKPEGKGEK